MGHFLSHSELQSKYNITTYLATMQIQERITKKLTNILKENILYTTPILNI